MKRAGTPAEKTDGTVSADGTEGITGAGSSAPDLRIMAATAGVVGVVTPAAAATVDTTAIPTTIMVDIHPSASTELTEKTAGRCG